MNKLYGYISYPSKDAPLISQLTLISKSEAEYKRLVSPDHVFTSATTMFLVVRQYDIVERPTGRDVATNDYSIWMAKHDLNFWGKESE